MTRVTVAEGKLRCGLLLKNLVRAFIPREDTSVRMCCGSFETEENGKVIVQDRNGKQEVFRFRSMQEARELLAWILEERPDLAAGHKREKREGFVY